MVADLFQHPLNFPTIAADVVFTEQIDRKWFGCFFFARIANDLVHQNIVGDMMAGRLTDSFVPLTVERHHLDAVPFFGGFGYRLDIIANQTDRAGSGNRNRFGVEYFHHFINRGRQFFFAAKHDIAFLHIGRKTIVEKIISRVRCFRFVAPGSPGIIAATYRAMHDMDHILERPEHNAFTAGISTAAVGDDSRNRAGIRFNLLIRF